MNEVSLAVRTPKGLAVIVGCSHPGVEKNLELHDNRKAQRVAPGHCTSELGFAVFMDRFKERFDRAGLGSVATLP